MRPAALFPASFALFCAALAACGGGSAGPTAPPSPSPVPSPSASPVVSAQCAGLAPGPVTRIAVAPREQSSDGSSVPMRARVDTPFVEEAWCVDKDKSHRLDFNLNQRNADGRECCWVGVPSWEVVEDGASIARSLVPIGETGFIGRLRVEPGGKTGAIRLEATLDGVKSYPWQSGSFYRREPFLVLSMSADDIATQCRCTFRGNGIYEGTGCRKIL